MITGIDHLVVLVENLAAASADYTRLGFTVVPGGEHSGGETHNALIAFTDGSYIELLAFMNPRQPSTHRWWPHIACGEGLIDYALASEDVSNTIGLARLRGCDLELVGPFEGGRVRTDGQQIRWRMGATSSIDSPLPFVIEDLTERTLRVPLESSKHSNGVLGIEEVLVAARQIDRALPEYGALLGVQAPDPEYDADLDVLQGMFVVGPHQIRVAQPTSPQSPLHAFLGSDRAEGIYSVTLVTSIRSGVAMDPTLLHGARLAIAEP